MPTLIRILNSDWLLLVVTVVVLAMILNGIGNMEIPQ